MPRFHCPLPLVPGTETALPPGPARHVQVLRLQPGDALTLFDGRGGEYTATVRHMGRSEVRVEVGPCTPVEREAARAVHLLAGITANERMDWLVEKATELGAASITPLEAGRSVLRLRGERADRKRGHWQGVAVAACEQCGRNHVPPVEPATALGPWLAGASTAGATAAQRAPQRLLLSLAAGARPLGELAAGHGAVTLLSGPEGGLTPEEEAAARAAGFEPVTLGPRVLRAETAPLAVLAALTLGG